MAKRNKLKFSNTLSKQEEIQHHLVELRDIQLRRMTILRTISEVAARVKDGESLIAGPDGKTRENIQEKVLNELVAINNAIMKGFEYHNAKISELVSSTVNDSALEVPEEPESESDAE